MRRPYSTDSVVARIKRKTLRAPETGSMTEQECCIVGAGPAGLMLGLFAVAWIF